jgi:multiple sugar transport system substrate-binding protein
MAGMKPAVAATDLEMSMWQYEQAGSGDWWKAVLGAFQAAHPDINVKVTNIPYASYLDQMTVRFAAGRPPGLVMLLPLNVGLFADQGWLEPLDDRLAGTPIGGPDWTPLQSMEIWDGKTRGVLISAAPDMLYYNQKLLDDAGVTVPGSYDEFVAAVAKGNHPDKGYYGLSAVTTEHPQIGQDLLEHIQWQGADPIKDGAYNFEDPQVVAAVDKWRNMIKANAPLGLNSTQNRQLFADGKALFMIAQPTIWAVVEKGASKADARLTATPFARTLGDGVIGLNIPAGIDKATQDAAWTLITFVTQPEWQRKFMQAVYSFAGLEVEIPAEVVATKPVYGALMAADFDIASRGPLEVPILKNSGEFYQIVTRAGVKLISTDDATADILAALQAQLEQAVPLR